MRLDSDTVSYETTAHNGLRVQYDYNECGGVIAVETWKVSPPGYADAAARNILHSEILEFPSDKPSERDARAIETLQYIGEGIYTFTFLRGIVQ